MHNAVGPVFQFLGIWHGETCAINAYPRVYVKQKNNTFGVWPIRINAFPLPRGPVLLLFSYNLRHLDCRPMWSYPGHYPFLVILQNYCKLDRQSVAVIVTATPTLLDVGHKTQDGWARIQTPGKTHAVDISSQVPRN
jgi:hypothetical protein